MKKHKIALAALLLHAVIMLVFCQDPGMNENRLQRVDGFLKELSLPIEKEDIFMEQLQSINSQFTEFINLKEDFETRVRNGENPWLGLNEEYQANIHSSWISYSDRMNWFTGNLEEVMSPVQIDVFYNFLLDELWYEGFVTQENTIVKESLLESSKRDVNADTAEFIREYGRDTFEKMLIEYDGEPDFPTKADLIAEEADRKIAVLEKEAIHSEDVVPPYDRIPPWKHMERPPASPPGIQYFFEQQNLPALQYFHVILFPRMVDMIRVKTIR
jgi:hypothetical protein